MKSPNVPRIGSQTLPFSPAELHYLNQRLSALQLKASEDGTILSADLRTARQTIETAIENATETATFEATTLHALSELKDESNTSFTKELHGKLALTSSDDTYTIELTAAQYNALRDVLDETEGVILPADDRTTFHVADKQLTHFYHVLRYTPVEYMSKDAYDVLDIVRDALEFQKN